MAIAPTGAFATDGEPRYSTHAKHTAVKISLLAIIVAFDSVGFTVTDEDEHGIGVDYLRRTKLMTIEGSVM